MPSAASQRTVVAAAVAAALTVVAAAVVWVMVVHGTYSSIRCSCNVACRSPCIDPDCVHIDCRSDLRSQVHYQSCKFKELNQTHCLERGTISFISISYINQAKRYIQHLLCPQKENKKDSPAPGEG